MNNSIELPESFGAIHLAIRISIFVVFGIPLLTVGLTFIVALLTARDINWKIRVVLINILGCPVCVYLIEGYDNDAMLTLC